MSVISSLNTFKLPAFKNTTNNQCVLQYQLGHCPIGGGMFSRISNLHFSVINTVLLYTFVINTVLLYTFVINTVLLHTCY